MEGNRILPCPSGDIYLPCALTTHPSGHYSLWRDIGLHTHPIPDESIAYIPPIDSRVGEMEPTKRKPGSEQLTRELEVD